MLTKASKLTKLSVNFRVAATNLANRQFSRAGLTGVQMKNKVFMNTQILD
jgi:hypothetical protein